MITETEQYKGTIIWSPAVSGTFAASTVYTATITLAPKLGYTLDCVPKNFFTMEGASTVTYEAGSNTVTAIFPATGAAPVIDNGGGGGGGGPSMPSTPTPTPSPTPTPTPTPDSEPEPTSTPVASKSTANVPSIIGSGNIYSGWAEQTLEKAQEMDLIPDSLIPYSMAIDYTKPISRREFAGIAVLTYESLSGKRVKLAKDNPFADTNSIDVLKAFSAGLMVGYSDTLFEPSISLNREQCATALTRVFKRFSIPGWSFATDADFPLAYTMVEPFDDDKYISDWARESVYFMASNEIIFGIGSNLFAPVNITSTQESIEYATATREQAIAISVRMVENLKDYNDD
jgi:hypothetical protein